MIIDKNACLRWFELYLFLTNNNDGIVLESSGSFLVLISCLCCSLFFNLAFDLFDSTFYSIS